MAVHTEQFHPLINKLAGLVAIIVGFLILASGYRYGSAGTIIIGTAIIIAGLAFLVLKIVRRNQGRL
jgi:hypothetical protein